MGSPTKPLKLFIVFAVFLITAFYLIPGPHQGLQEGLAPFPGEENRKDASRPGSQQLLKPAPKVNLIKGIPAIGFGTWRSPQSEACSPIINSLIL